MATTALNRKQLVTTSQQRVFNIRQISTILFYRRFLILGISCVVMTATSLLAVITKPMYQSSMQIMVSGDMDQDLLSKHLQTDVKNELGKAHLSSIEYTNHKRILMSYKLIQKTVDLLRSHYPDLTIEDITGKIDTGKTAFLQIFPSDNVSYFNQVFVVSFKDPNPVKTKRVLQALQKVYQDYNLEQKYQLVNRGLLLVNNRLPKLQKEALDREQKLELFRKEHNLIVPLVQSKILLPPLADIHKERQTIRTQIADLQSRYNSLEKSFASSNQDTKLVASLSRSSSYQALVDEIRKTRISLAEERLRYTEDSPVVVRLKQKYQVQIALLQQELKVQDINTNTTNEKLSEVETKLTNELRHLGKILNELILNENNLAKSEQIIRSQVNTYPGLIAEYNRLLLDVKVQRKALEQLLQLQQSLGVKIAQGGFDWQILEEPDLGIYIGNKKWSLIIGGFLIGPILCVIFTLICEIFNKVIFSPLDLHKLTNLRLLGSVPQLGKPSFQTRLNKIVRYKQQNSIPAISGPKTKLSSHETLDMIYQNLQIFKNSLPFKSLILTSALPGEGKTTLALGLGASAAQMHQRVLVIDANLRSPSLHKILAISND